MESVVEKFKRQYNEIHKPEEVKDGVRKLSYEEYMELYRAGIITR